jgi:hypothetical protein
MAKCEYCRGKMSPAGSSVPVVGIETSKNLDRKHKPYCSRRTLSTVSIPTHSTPDEKEAFVARLVPKDRCVLTADETLMYPCPRKFTKKDAIKFAVSEEVLRDGK